MTRLFSFRFDVDTHRCVREGMPALSALGRRLEAPFTFFVNMGRAVSHRVTVSGLLERATSDATRVAAKYSARDKLGGAGFLRAALLNPRVGSASPGVLRGALHDGHEIGLHGGRNHAVWQRRARRWAPGRTEREIDAVLPELRRLLDGGPVGFSSPGWATPPGLPEILARRGFRYFADAHGPAGDPSEPGVFPVDGDGLVGVRTALTGEPGGVAYLEHLRASGLDDDDVVRRFERDLERAGPVAVAYDHPYFAGVRELPLVERLVEAARGAGYDVVALATLAEAEPS